jgi:hypothetical protein
VRTARFVDPGTIAGASAEIDSLLPDGSDGQKPADGV